MLTRKLFRSKLLFVAILVLSSGCETLRSITDSRNDDSTNSRQRTKNERSNLKVTSSQVIQEAKVSSSRKKLSDSTVLKSLENSLSSKKEMEQYSKALPLLDGPEERIEFLSLPGFEARQEWINQNRVSERSKQIGLSFEQVVKDQDIAIGMPQNLVRQSWGEPDSVEVSGNPVFKNERWRYFKYVSTMDGYKNEKKTVYFEAGKVVGWDME